MFGLKFAQYSKIKICPKTFCPKWRFTKSVPGLLEELLLSVPGLHGREDVEEAGRVADDIAVAVVDEDLRSDNLSSKFARAGSEILNRFRIQNVQVVSLIGLRLFSARFQVAKVQILKSIYG
jgi:hypothetical protein